MKIRHIALITIIAATVTALPCRGQDNAAQDFSGKVSSVDQAAKTFTVNGQTYQILPTSKITSNQQPATASVVAEGEQVSGKYKMSAENKMEILSLNISGEPESASAFGGTTDSYSAQSGTEYSGKVTSVDQAAKTIKVGGQTLQAIASTRIMQNNQPAQLSDIQVGQQVSGKYKPSAENKKELLTVHIGEAAASNTGGTQSTAASESEQSFSGRILKVDPAAQTITVGKRKFSILPTTMMTGAAGGATTLNNLKVGQQVNGTFKTSTAGKNELLTLEVGAKNKNKK